MSPLFRLGCVVLLGRVWVVGLTWTIAKHGEPCHSAVSLFPSQSRSKARPRPSPGYPVSPAALPPPPLFGDESVIATTRP